MGNHGVPAWEEISLDEFKDALQRYSPLIEDVSKSRGAKGGQKTLAELDRYRYVDAPQSFSLQSAGKVMGLDDVKSLVEWKLRHGKFRPTLMKLVSSNDSSFVQDTIKQARISYQKDKDVSAALAILTKLKGIGPATASLLLAILDPEHVPFFGDEVFYWLCCDGKVLPIKYNAKEYKELNEHSRKLAKRLGVKAIDIEQVAYVLMKQPGETPVKDEAPKEKDTKAAGHKATAKPASKSQAAVPAKTAAKRKQRSEDDTDQEPSVRRSRRGQRV
ncbi:hypothetical protein UCRPA7_5938 [Phaeoacremonium minimum UCRPA7]|uniref:Uncharacterized protein n=1 Tax=Phaeoacremonium minimum (strain UCR-PA7) TaxID=1286976 RepID=R8BGX7_PHAM7|nr:hypothetical protein UCRPA7_5938 [Phaeoacremonium minimum UCRPA7]EON98563.1 hypothetical protein UCRPA7_5938 [Phaeoacremonium minimum UCRPA7]